VGGAIMPGPELAASSLASRTAKLGSVPLVRPLCAVGRTTAGAIQSGVLFGQAGAVDRLVSSFRSELGGKAKVVATGGLAGRVAELCHEPMELRPEWTLDGLRRAWERLSARS
jgi:type III pantothenate kinase